MDLLWQLQINITLFFQNLGTWLETPMKAFSFLGNEEFFIIIMPLLYWCINALWGIRTGLMLILSGGLNEFLKVLFHSPRPFWIDPRVKALVSETSFGLPSGHAQNSISIWGSLAVSVRRKWFTIVIFIVILLIGLSRIYLGVHFTTDVLFGWIIGGLIIWIYFLLEKRIAAWISPKPLGLQILYIFAFSIALLLLGIISRTVTLAYQIPEEWLSNANHALGLTPNPFDLEGIVTLSGVAFGFLSGFAWWVKKYGLPTVQGSLWKRVARYIFGLIGVLIFYLGLKLVFPEQPFAAAVIFRFIRYGLIGLWVSALAPWLFIKLRLNK
jgi:membrane-associated phospholipid phosphatase